jgi:cysteinyl-tRNA synthetase
MVRMIQRLLDRGHAYLADDGSVHFRIASFPHYGQLKQLSADSVRAGASGRVRADEYEKESVGDFALWKGWDPADGDVVWDATFTIDGATRAVRGRPGWHIECSVMGTEILGDQIDLHLGGEDLLFPHHENEIAQSEGATGVRPFVRYWMHRRHLLVDGAKMSKSKRNFFRLSDIEERAGLAGVRGFRYLVTTTHYRSPIDFTWKALDAAVRTLRNLEDAVRRLEAAAGSASPSAFAKDWETAFAAAMDDDLETSGAIAAVHEMIRECNRRADAGSLSAADAASALALVERADRALGLMLERGPVAVPEDVRRLLERRSAARAAGDFAQSDRIRQELSSLGYAVKDGPGGRQDVVRSG